MELMPTLHILSKAYPLLVCQQGVASVCLSMALRLSEDEWRGISDYLQCAALSHVCRKTWTILQRRHLVWYAGSSNVVWLVRMIRDSSATCTLSITCKDAGDEGAKALAELRDVPSLTTLCLHLEGNEIGSQGAQALASLKDSKSLSALVLNLRFNAIQEGTVLPPRFVNPYPLSVAFPPSGRRGFGGHTGPQKGCGGWGKSGCL